MLLSKLFKLEGELPFINVNTSSDTMLFIDPMMLKASNDSFDQDCLLKLNSFWSYAISALDTLPLTRMQKLFSHFHEDNRTHLGMSRFRSIGKGIGAGKADTLLDVFMTNKAIKDGIVPEIIDMALFVEGIGPDNISDMITNILKKELAEYTELQCKHFGIPMRDFNIGHYWNIDTLSWKTLNARLPFDERGNSILFVPKTMASDYARYTGWRYFNLIVLPTKRVNKETKEQLRIEYVWSVPFITQETLRDPALLLSFKEMVLAEYKEMIRLYGFSDAVFSITFGIGKINLRLKSFKDALISKKDKK